MNKILFILAQTRNSNVPWQIGREGRKTGQKQKGSWGHNIVMDHWQKKQKPKHVKDCTEARLKEAQISSLLWEENKTR